MTVELFQFRYSPYNEKARWMLDLKRLPHRRISVLPGPHLLKIRSLSGQTATPVLRIDGEVIADSARILDALERRFPAPPLMPAGDAGRRRVEEIQTRFDTDWTPRIRRVVLTTLMEDPAYWSLTFGAGSGLLTQRLYAMVVPLARSIIRRGNGITGPASIEDGFAAAKDALDFVAAESRATGYLVGDRFTLADLVAAAALASTCDPPHPDMERPVPHSRGVASWILAWHDHPGVRWVRTMYEQHRPAPMAQA
jgi:glutathione S-transferase